jgi:hypothetical protein
MEAIGPRAGLALGALTCFAAALIGLAVLRRGAEARERLTPAPAAEIREATLTPPAPEAGEPALSV